VTRRQLSERCKRATGGPGLGPPQWLKEATGRAKRKHERADSRAIKWPQVGWEERAGLATSLPNGAVHSPLRRVWEQFQHGTGIHGRRSKWESPGKPAAGSGQQSWFGVSLTARCDCEVWGTLGFPSCCQCDECERPGPNTVHSLQRTTYTVQT
jgi:hypothetical protein